MTERKTLGGENSYFLLYLEFFSPHPSGERVRVRYLLSFYVTPECIYQESTVFKVSVVFAFRTSSFIFSACRRHVCFNPLQVGYKQKMPKIIATRKDAFQSLIGRLQTTIWRDQNDCYQKVSIPYRQATNQTMKEKIRLSFDLFQSLIGRLQTRIDLEDGWKLQSFNPLQVGYEQTVIEPKEKEPKEFQSLIGRLRTVTIKSNNYLLRLFQSLIGRLRTSKDVKVALRYLLFQSLIGRLRTKKQEFITHLIEEFQSLIGRLRTI